MKLLVSSGVLLSKLSAIQGVLANNPIVPILEDFLFELDSQKLTVTASDLQTTIITSIDVESTDKGKVAIPAKLLLDTLKGLPEQPITIKINETNYAVELISANGRYKLAGEDSVNFPKTAVILEGQSTEVNLTSSGLLSAINSTLFAVSNDDLRPAMTGVFMQLRADQTTFVGTDGHKLVRYVRQDIKSVEDVDAILSRKALIILKSILPSTDIQIQALFGNSNISFNFNGMTVISQLIDERYPDYANAIPSDNPFELVIGRSELLSSLKRMAIYANKTTNQVRFKISGEELNIISEDLDYSNEANEKLKCEYKGDEMEIGFNAKFLIEVLNSMSSKVIRIELSSPKRAGLIFPVGDNDTLILVMPVMLNSTINA